MSITCTAVHFALRGPLGCAVETVMNDGRRLPLLDGGTGEPVVVPAATLNRLGLQRLLAAGQRLHDRLSGPVAGTLSLID